MTFYWYNNKVISLPPTLCCPRPLPYHGFHQLQLFLPGNMRSLNSVEPRLSATSSSPSSNPGHANPTPNVTAPTARDPWVLQQLAQGGCLSRVWTGAAPTPAQMPHALCLHHSHCPLERAPDLAHFPPKHHLPAPSTSTPPWGALGRPAAPGQSSCLPGPHPAPAPVVGPALPPPGLTDGHPRGAGRSLPIGPLCARRGSSWEKKENG